jgi:NADP-dependent 3-hydroxy acid dehydrogenase YdfG
VNNAGNAANGFSTIDEGSVADWGCYDRWKCKDCTSQKPVLPYMVKRKMGHIINQFSHRKAKRYANGAV